MNRSHCYIWRDALYFSERFLVFFLAHIKSFENSFLTCFFGVPFLLGHHCDFVCVGEFFKRNKERKENSHWSSGSLSVDKFKTVSVVV